jgi:hypothetical protein
MTTVNIRFRIPEQTLRLERSRRPATMSRDDLEWIFGGEVDFVDVESHRLLLSLEVPLLGFAKDLSQLVGQFRADGSYQISDRYGSYRLIVTLKKNSVNVSDVATSQMLEAEASQLIYAIGDFAQSLRDSLTRLFPELNANPEFDRLSREIADRFLADQRATESLRPLGWRNERDKR